MIQDIQRFHKIMKVIFLPEHQWKRSRDKKAQPSAHQPSSKQLGVPEISSLELAKTVKGETLALQLERPVLGK